MKILFRRINWILISQFGLDFKRLLKAPLRIPKFIADFFKFRLLYKGAITIKPCLHDSTAGAGELGEYFWQDLFVAKLIFDESPAKHVDIGSRIDGFVAHVASYRELEVFDIRPIKQVIPGVIFRQLNLMDKNIDSFINYCDSLSCLHALEHFGLGRYSDPINITGPYDGLRNIAKIVKANGMFYLSVPIGKEVVEFNANYIFNPIKILRFCEELGFKLKELVVVSQGGKLIDRYAPNEDMKELSIKSYNLGIFIMKKNDVDNS